jgi:hypothetical protein
MNNRRILQNFFSKTTYSWLTVLSLLVALSLFLVYPASGYVLCGINWNWLGGNPRVVNFKVNGNCLDASAGNAENQIAVIQAASESWNAAGANFNFNYNGTHTHTGPSHNNVNEVMWQNTSGGGALATTSIWYTGGNVQECDMVFWDAGITWHGGSSAPPSNMFDIQSVGTHEFGHFLCLDHTPIQAAVMYYAIGNGQMKRNLHQDDINGIFAIYPEQYPPPHDLVAEDGHDRQVPVSWQRPPTAFPSRYRLYRSTSGSEGPFDLVDSTAGGETSIIDDGLTNGQTYWYKTTAVYYYYPIGVSQFSNVDDGTPAPQAGIAVSTDTLDFGTVIVNESLSLELWIYNTGSLPLNVTNISMAPTYAPYFEISSTSFSVPSDDSSQITITFTPQAQESYNCALAILNNSPVPTLVIQIRAEGSLLGVTEELAGPVPSNYSLEQNHPNPFNPVTTIDFGVPHASEIRLAVYDVMGRHVATLVQGMMPAGNYQASWNAENVPSGIYFCRFEAGSKAMTRKMILLR